MNSPKVVFWLPKALWPQTWPLSETDNWPGFSLGVYAWTIQTWLRLKAVGFKCSLSQNLPDSGIVLFHSNSPRIVQSFPKPKKRQLFICIRAEAPPHPYAQLQIVQNPTEAGARQFFIPHWPQPGLLARDPKRADRFETVAFLGHRNNLATELLSPDWHEQLQALGLRWRPVIHQNMWNDYNNTDNRWHDYRSIDAVVAVRSFDKKVYKQTNNFRNKPPTKLYNAWLAGVPALLGPESAFSAVRQTPLDYIEVHSPEALLEGLAHLRDSINLRRAMITQANHRSKGCTPDVIVQQWIQFLEAAAIPAYEHWCQNNTLKQYWSRSQAYILSWRERFSRRTKFIF